MMILSFDLSIKTIGGIHRLKILSKPTYTDTADFNHPISHIHAAFHRMVHRLVNIPLQSGYSSPGFTIDIGIFVIR